MSSSPDKSNIAVEFRERSDRAYREYIAQSQSPECQGWEQKIKEGTFGQAELEANGRAMALYGQHVAYANAANMARGANIPSAIREPAAYIQHHKAGDNLVWDNPGGKCTPLFTNAAPQAATGTVPPESSAPAVLPSSSVRDISDAEMVRMMVAAGYDTEAVHPHCYARFSYATLFKLLASATQPASIPPGVSVSVSYGPVVDGPSEWIRGVLGRVDRQGPAYVQATGSWFAFTFDKIVGYSGQSIKEIGLKEGREVWIQIGTDGLVKRVSLNEIDSDGKV